MKRINIFLKVFCFLAVVFPFVGTACKPADPLSSRTNSPKYLLNGTFEDTFGNFDYYSIENGTEYAIALKESARGNAGTITIPTEYNGKPVTGIWRSGFYKSHYSTINIPTAITVIDYEAFLGSYITTLTIPASVTDIGEGAFYACRKLTKATLQNSTTSSSVSSACSCTEVVEPSNEERHDSTLKLIPSFCFFNCIALKELVLPQSIEEIGYEAFFDCYSLFSTISFANIKTINSRAFQDCKALKKVYISSSFFAIDQTTQKPVGIMGENAFIGCNSNLEFYLVGDENDITTWRGLAANTNWNCKSEYVAPGEPNNPDVSASNRYTYHISDADASYTNDWIYTVNNGNVEITSYIGPTSIDGNSIEFLTIPDEIPSGSGNKVRTIHINAFSSVKALLKRLYLPKTLERIENGMFDGGYTNLEVIDDNTAATCTNDSAAQSLTPRIILNGITDLKYIGAEAFVSMAKLTSITKLYLPYSIIAVGRNAFGSTANSKHLTKVTDFKWDYDDTKSALEVIGREAFYMIGRSATNGSYLNGNNHQNYLTNTGTHNYELTTLIIPRTFKHFGIKETYSTITTEADDANFGVRAFAGSPLLEKVIFKGSNTKTETTDLIIPSLTFARNQNLRTIVFEERKDRGISFHTVNGLYQPAIGWSAGKGSNDFGGDPALQTLVLPNKNTTLYIQDFAFQGNSRAAIYLSSTLSSSKIKRYSKDRSCSSVVSNISSNSTAFSEETIKNWRTIGNEEPYNTTVYPGYDFSANHNAFGIDQKMPVYENVLYKDQVTNNSNTINVEVGTGNTNEYIVKDKCSFVCNTPTGKATMTNYLYDRHDSSFTGTATVPASVANSNSVSYDVTVIGASAFSACYCDTNSYNGYGSYKDLTAVVIPDGITEIQEYAFMRAYGVTKVSTNVTNSDYVMPSSLTSIGRHAFAFCNIVKCLNIPTTCTFYETTQSDTPGTGTLTCAFINNFSLRKITFGNNETYSDYYETTTYTHSGDTYTSALYSKSTTTGNKSALLMVLNRDVADYHAESQDATVEPVNINGVATDCARFNGAYRNHFLFGAFKMCYWIESLITGTAIDGDLSQPLISGIRENVYLNIPYNFVKDNAALKPALKAISINGTTEFATPAYSFAGCDLQVIELPYIKDGVIPAGLFSFLEYEHVIFRTPDQNGDLADCPEGVLDLRYTGYAGIAAEAFKGSIISEVIAPKPYEEDPNNPGDFLPNNFFIDTDAFAECEGLTNIDFSNVTGTVTLTAAFRKATIQNDLFDFGTSAYIEFGAETFKECSFPGHSFEFPVKTREIGASCFEGCAVGYGQTGANDKTLKYVTAAGDLVHMKRITDPDEIDAKNSNQNNWDKKDIGFKQIGNYAFYKCDNLISFPFANFTELERIGHYAFSMHQNYRASDGALATDDNAHINQYHANSATLTSDGRVILPASLTNLGVGAFHSSCITYVKIQSSYLRFERGAVHSASTLAQYNKGMNTFRVCKQLVEVFFTNPDCELPWWKYYTSSEGGQENIFSNCTSITKITLPTGYDIQHFGTSTDKKYRPDSMVYNSNGTGRIYCYKKTKDMIKDVAGASGSDYWVSEKWRNSNPKVLPVVFYVTVNTDLATNASGTWAEIRLQSEYWTAINDEIVYLGKIDGAIASDGTIKFTEKVNGKAYIVNGSGVSLEP